MSTIFSNGPRRHFIDSGSDLDLSDGPLVFNSRSPKTTLRNDSERNEKHDMISCLAAAQRNKLDLLDVSWEEARGNLGKGGQGVVTQSLISLDATLAFKRTYPNTAEKNSPRIRQVFQEVFAEISVLGDPMIKRHPNVVTLEGICWEIRPDGDVWPVLIFPAASFQDLGAFLSRCGAELGFDGRVKLSDDVASALGFLHEQNIIHGDIKPQNILIFGTSPNEPIPKITDFGYSTRYASTDTSRVMMPYTIPWNAPEHKSYIPDYSVTEAKKMDVFSFGVLSLWILFREALEALGQKIRFPAQQGERLEGLWGNLARSSALPLREGFVDAVPASIFSLILIRDVALSQDVPATTLDYAMCMVGESTALTSEEKERLYQLFKRALPADIGSRVLDWGELRKYLHRNGSLEHIPLSNGDPCPDFSQTDQNFQIAPELSPLCLCNQIVRTTVFHSLQENADDKNLSADRRVNAAFQVAICWKVGFGTHQSDRKTAEYLAQSGRGRGDLMAEIESTKTMREVYNPTIGKYRGMGLLAPGAISAVPQSSTNLFEIETSLRDEIDRMQRSLGRLHPAVYNLKIRLSIFLRNIGHPSLIDMCAEILNDVRSLGIRSKENVLKSWSAKANLAGSLINFGDPDSLLEAESLSREANEELRSIYGDDNINVWQGVFQMARIAAVRLDTKEAVRLVEKARAGFEKVVGPMHELTIQCTQFLVENLKQMGQTDKAEKALIDCLNKRRGIRADSYPVIVQTKMELVTILRANGKYGEAQKYHNEVEATITAKTPNNDHVMLKFVSADLLFLQEIYSESAHLYKILLDNHPLKFRAWPPPNPVPGPNLARVVDHPVFRPQEFPHDPQLMDAYLGYIISEQAHAFCIPDDGKSYLRQQGFSDARIALCEFLFHISRFFGRSTEAEPSFEEMPSQTSLMTYITTGHCYGLEILARIGSWNDRNGLHYKEAISAADEMGFDVVGDLLREHQALCGGPSDSSAFESPQELQHFLSGEWGGSFLSAEGGLREIRTNLQSLTLKPFVAQGEPEQEMVGLAGTATDKIRTMSVHGEAFVSGKLYMRLTVVDDKAPCGFHLLNIYYSGYLHRDRKAFGGQWRFAEQEKRSLLSGTFFFYFRPEPRLAPLDSP